MNLKHLSRLSLTLAASTGTLALVAFIYITFDESSAPTVTEDVPRAAVAPVRLGSRKKGKKTLILKVQFPHLLPPLQTIIALFQPRNSFTWMSFLKTSLTKRSRKKLTNLI